MERAALGGRLRLPYVLLPLALLLCSSLPASAQPLARPKIALLAPSVDAAITVSEAKATLERMGTHLRRHGYAVQPVSVTRKRLPTTLRACIDPTCAAEAVRPLGVDLVLVTFIVPGPRGGAVIRVELVDKAGAAYPGAMISADSPSPIEDALDTALARQARGPGPWLTVQGQPAGAEVLLNGVVVGALPRYYARIEPGVVQVSVRARGYRNQSQMVEIDPSLYAHAVVEVALAPAPDDLTIAPVHVDQTELVTALDDLPDERPTTGSPWNYVLGGVGVAAGLALWVKPALTLAKQGECHERSSGACESVVHFGSAATIHAVAGSVLVLGGAAVLIFQPFQVELYPEDDAAMLLVGGTL